MEKFTHIQHGCHLDNMLKDGKCKYTSTVCEKSNCPKISAEPLFVRRVTLKERVEEAVKNCSPGHAKQSFA